MEDVRRRMVRGGVTMAVGGEGGRAKVVKSCGDAALVSGVASD